MTFNANLFVCNNCNWFVIAEELETHKCRALTDYRVAGSILLVCDGERWYPLNLTNQKGTTVKNNQRGNGTTIVVLLNLRLLFPVVDFRLVLLFLVNLVLIIPIFLTLRKPEHHKADENYEDAGKHEVPISDISQTVRRPVP